MVRASTRARPTTSAPAGASSGSTRTRSGTPASPPPAKRPRRPPARPLRPYGDAGVLAWRPDRHHAPWPQTLVLLVEDRASSPRGGAGDGRARTIRRRGGGGAPLPGGRHWAGAGDGARRAVPDMAREHAERAAELRVLRRLLPLPLENPGRFVDLGAGPGTVAGPSSRRSHGPRRSAWTSPPGGSAWASATSRRSPACFAYVEQDLADLRWEGPLAGPFPDGVVALPLRR